MHAWLLRTPSSERRPPTRLIGDAEGRGTKTAVAGLRPTRAMVSCIAASRQRNRKRKNVGCNGADSVAESLSSAFKGAGAKSLQRDAASRRPAKIANVRCERIINQNRDGRARPAKTHATAAAAGGGAAAAPRLGAAYHCPGCRVMSRAGLTNISEYCGSDRKAGTSSARPDRGAGWLGEASCKLATARRHGTGATVCTPLGSQPPAFAAPTPGALTHAQRPPDPTQTMVLPLPVMKALL